MQSLDLGETVDETLTTISIPQIFCSCAPTAPLTGPSSNCEGALRSEHSSPPGNVSFKTRGHQIGRIGMVDPEERRPSKLRKKKALRCWSPADKKLFYQQNLAGRRLAIVVLPSGQRPRVEPCIAEVARAVDEATPGSFRKILASQAHKA